MLIDLQLHSTYSDGYLTPTQLAKFMADKGIRVAAITDHNTVGGISEFKIACQKHKIKAIPGLELYVKLGNKKFNILWYNLDYKNPELHKILRDSQARRRQKARVALKKLVRRGFKIEIEKILDKYNHYVPINHVIDEIKTVPHNLKKIKKKLNTQKPQERQVIKEYFRNPYIGILQNSYIDIKRVLKLRKKIGGQIVLCHPAKNNSTQKDFLEKIKKLGVEGIELFSPHHTWGALMHIQVMAREFDFIETGGSDFHRFEGDNLPLQYSWEYYKIESKNLRGIRKIIG